jgi:hypothetical protein
MTTADASGTQQTGTQQATATGTQDATATEVAYKFQPIEGIQLAPEFDQDIAAVAKDMGWDQATAEKFRAREAKQAHEALLADKKLSEESAAKAKLEKEQADAQRKTEWEKANREHKEFGGQKYAETSERVKQLLARFDTDQAFSKELEAAPELLDHPAFRGFLARIAYSMADGKLHESSTSPAKKSDAELFYGNKA